MIDIKSLKDYVDTISEKEFMELAINIYLLTEYICKDYPNYKEWYFRKQLPATINSDERNIFFVQNPENNDEIISMACLKKDAEEKKICTLYVSDKCRGLGIGNAIIEKSMMWLGTTKPLVTLADYKLDMFKPIINKYGWELTEVVSGLYNNKSQELCFNGTLMKNNNETLEQQLHKKLIKALKKRCEQIK